MHAVRLLYSLRSLIAYILPRDLHELTRDMSFLFHNWCVYLTNIEQCIIILAQHGIILEEEENGKNVNL